MINITAKSTGFIASIVNSKLFAFCTPQQKLVQPASTTDTKLEGSYRDETSGAIYQITTKRRMLDLLDEINTVLSARSLDIDEDFRETQGYQLANLGIFK